MTTKTSVQGEALLSDDCMGIH